MAQTGGFLFQNVAYRPTVYKTGVQSKVEFWQKNTPQQCTLSKPPYLCGNSMTSSLVHCRLMFVDQKKVPAGTQCTINAY